MLGKISAALANVSQTRQVFHLSSHTIRDLWIVLEIVVVYDDRFVIVSRLCPFSHIFSTLRKLFSTCEETGKFKRKKKNPEGMKMNKPSSAHHSDFKPGSQSQRPTWQTNKLRSRNRKRSPFDHLIVQLTDLFYNTTQHNALASPFGCVRVPCRSCNYVIIRISQCASIVQMAAEVNKNTVNHFPFFKWPSSVILLNFVDVIPNGDCFKRPQARLYRAFLSISWKRSFILQPMHLRSASGV